MNIPETVTVSCPMKSMQQRYIVKGCLSCGDYKGIALLTDATEMDIKDRVTGEVKGKRPIQWHEKHIVRCSFPMSRRCSDMSVVEDD